MVPLPQHLATAYSVRSILGFGMGSPWLFGVVLDTAGGTPAAWGWAWTMLGALALVGPWATWKLRSGNDREEQEGREWDEVHRGVQDRGAAAGQRDDADGEGQRGHDLPSGEGRA